MFRPILATAGLTMLLVASATAVHADSAEQLARRLASLRAEVEERSEQLTQHKADTRNQVQALARQKSDLQVELDREQLRAAKLRDALARKRREIAETSSEGEDLQPIFAAAIDTMRGYVERSLPFRRDERLAEIARIEEQQRTGLLTYPRALTRLWSFIEDELRMTRENAMYQQTIRIDGREQLADVVRIGMVMLFFRTDHGELGFTQKTADGWRFVTTTDSDQRKLIRNLFDSFQKQIRTGLFRLPNALPVEGSR